MKTAYFILGMHRSGTSALAGVLDLIGLDFGSELMKPHAEQNPKGFFENVFIQRLDESIFRDAKYSWNDYNFNIHSIEVDRKIYVKKAQNILLKEFKYTNKFAIKDPRICLLFPIWEEACNERNIDIKVIIPCRNPLEVALSLQKRNGFSIEKGLILWLHHFFNAELFSRGTSRIFTTFDELLEETPKTLKKLSTFTNTKLSKYRIEQIEDFLDSNIKHNNIPIENFADDVPIFLQTIVNFIKQEDFTDIALLDKMRIDFYSSLELFHHKEIKDDLIELIQVKDDLRNKELALEELTKRKELELKEQEEKKEREIKSLEEQKVKELEELTKRKELELKELDKKKELEFKNFEKSKNKEIDKKTSELLNELHKVQELVEKYYLENEKQKTKLQEKKYYGAGQRIKNQLSYRVGAHLVKSSHSFFGMLFLPITFFGVMSEYKEYMKERKTKKLPPIEKYSDYYDALRVQNHLSYLLGQTVVNTLKKNPFSIVILPFRLFKTYSYFKSIKKGK